MLVGASRTHILFEYRPAKAIVAHNHNGYAAGLCTFISGFMPQPCIASPRIDCLILFKDFPLPLRPVER